MAKLIALATLLVALFAGATAYTTVVTTVIDNPQYESCQSEVQRMQMTHCMRWMEQGFSPYETVLRSAVASTEDLQRECCREMKNVRRDCHCEMMRRMKMMEPRMEMGKMQTMFSRCGMQMPMECRFM